MKHREFADACAALEKVRTLKHQRAETVHDAVSACLAWVGARRLLAASQGDPVAAQDRRLVAALADLEEAAVRLDAIPSRGATLWRRREAWSTVLDRVGRVQRLLDVERVTRGAGLGGSRSIAR